MGRQLQQGEYFRGASLKDLPDNVSREKYSVNGAGRGNRGGFDFDGGVTSILLPEKLYSFLMQWIQNMLQEVGQFTAPEPAIPLKYHISFRVQPEPAFNKEMEQAEAALLDTPVSELKVPWHTQKFFEENGIATVRQLISHKK